MPDLFARTKKLPRSDPLPGTAWFSFSSVFDYH